MSMATMSEKLANAASVSRRTGEFVDPRDPQEQQKVEMAPAFVVLTIEPLMHMGFEKAQDFVLNHSHPNVLIAQHGKWTDDIDIHERNMPGKTRDAEFIRKKYLAGKTSNDVQVGGTDCLYIPSPYISKYHAIMHCYGKGIAITPFPLTDPGEAVPKTFVNEEVLSKGQWRVLRPGDVISFHEPKTTKQFCKWEVKRIAYGGPQPLTRSGDLEEDQLAKLHQIDAKWPLDIPTVTAASTDVTDSVDITRQSADATAADPVAHQLALQLLASPHLAFVQQLLAQGNADNTSLVPIVRAFEEATAQGAHTLRGDTIEAPTAPEAESNLGPKESELRSQADLKKGPTIKQEYQDPEEREPATTLKRKYSNSMKIAGVQKSPHVTRTKTSIQRKHQMQHVDDSEDEGSADKARSSWILEQLLEQSRANTSVPALPKKSQPASTTPSFDRPSSRPAQAPEKRKSKRTRLQ